MRWHTNRKKNKQDQLPNQGGPIHQAEVAFNFLLFLLFLTGASVVPGPKNGGGPVTTQCPLVPESWLALLDRGAGAKPSLFLSDSLKNRPQNSLVTG